MSDLPQLLHQLRVRVEQETVEVSAWKTDPENSDASISEMVSTPNPAYSGLLGVVRVEANWCTCVHCGNPPYITRSWEGLPPKALEGALAYGIDHIIENHDNSLRWTRCYRQLIDMIDMGGDTREASVKAVLEALGEGRG